MQDAGCRNQDMIQVQVIGQIRNKQLIERVSELLLENIIPTKLRRPIEITINILTVCDEQAGGYCWGDRSTVEIEIARTSNEHTYSREKMLTNLTHELIHAKQFIMGEITPNMNMWKQQEVNRAKVPYSHQPWEREAYRWEKRLYDNYFKKLNV
jgi:hypothetical protein